MTTGEAILLGLLEAAPDAIIGVGADGRIVLVNAQTEALFGYPRAELIGQPVEILVPESHRVVHRDEREVYVANPRTRPLHSGLDLAGRRKDGSEFPAEISLSATETGEGLLVWAIVRDVTESRRADVRFRDLVEAAPDAIVAVGEDGRIALVNAQTEMLFGYPRAELIGQPVEILVPESARVVHRGHREAYVADPTTRPMGSGLDLAGRRKDGSEFPAEISLSAIETDEGLLISAVVRDVSERQKAAIIASSSDLILSMTLEGTVTSWNPAAERLHGAAAMDAIGRSIEELLAAKHAELMRALVARVTNGERIDEFDMALPRAGGGTVDIAFTMSPVVDSEGEIVGVSAIGRDRTEQRRAEIQRRNLEERLNQAQRLESLGQLTGGIAHDFNNLLAVILNYASFVAEDVRDNPSVRADVEMIRAAGERAARLVQQLLIFGRQETVQHRALDVNDIVIDVRQMLSRTLGEHVEVVVVLGGDLPAVRSDRSQMEQVLVNLAVNARDAMPDGGVLTVETCSIDLDEGYSEVHPDVRPGRHVRLSVSDTGSGMTKEVQDRAFEPFFTTKPQGFGTGLGLATVYGIVRESGGAMSLYSEMDLGTTVSILLPAVEEQVVAITAPETLAPPIGGGQTVLVVEDEEAMRKVTARMLHRNGYAVLEAASGEEALAIAARGEVDLLLTDVVMPQMSGRELAERIQRLHPTVPVVFMSGYSQGVLSPQRVLAEDVHLIRKPFDTRALLEIVYTAMTSSSPIGPIGP